LLDLWGDEPVSSSTIAEPATPTKPPIAKIVVGVGISLTVVAGLIRAVPTPINEQISFYLVCVAQGINAFAAYLGWSS
jgi:hypothetical protein